MDDVNRRSTPIALELLDGFRVLVIDGPRQAGKSTLVTHVQADRGPLVSLDDPPTLARAVDDPVGFLSDLAPRSAIDEFQRGGSPLLLALKNIVDADRARGRFLLAGSTRFLTTRRLSDSLTGRVGIVTLLPFSVGEARGVVEQFVDRCFAGFDVDELRCDRLTRNELASLIVTGGFPEMVLGPSSARFRRSWARSYVDTVIAPTNVEPVADLRRHELLPGMLQQLAARSAQELVISDVARELVVDEGTTRSYLEVLETLFVVRHLPGWTSSQTNRAKRRRKVHLVDTAIACGVLNVSESLLVGAGAEMFGPLVESFVVAELVKQAQWCDDPTTLSHYRDRDGHEVDIILERGREIVGIEVKASATPLPSDAKNLAYLRDRIGSRFKGGVVLHAGTHQTPLGDRIVALPISALWSP